MKITWKQTIATPFSKRKQQNFSGLLVKWGSNLFPGARLQFSFLKSIKIGSEEKA